MTIKLTLNGRPVTAQIEDGMTLYEFVRSRGCCSVKCGCETSNCGLCTVFLNDLPVLSCSVLAAQLFREVRLQPVPAEGGVDLHALLPLSRTRGRSSAASAIPAW